jgi:hypothetical protein
VSLFALGLAFVPSVAGADGSNVGDFFGHHRYHHHHRKRHHHHHSYYEYYDSSSPFCYLYCSSY